MSQGNHNSSNLYKHACPSKRKTAYTLRCYLHPAPFLAYARHHPLHTRTHKLSQTLSHTHRHVMRSLRTRPAQPSTVKQNRQTQRSLPSNSRLHIRSGATNTSDVRLVCQDDCPGQGECGGNGLDLRRLAPLNGETLPVWIWGLAAR